MSSPGVTLELVAVHADEDVNVVIGQAHFIKTVEDLHEVLAGAGGQLAFGVAFCEASGDRLVRRSGNDEVLVAAATAAAQAIGAGHSFVVMLRNGFPVSVLNAIKNVPEVCTVLCATANPVHAIVADSPAGRGLVGVIDGAPPVGVETETDRQRRHDLLRRMGYKL